MRVSSIALSIVLLLSISMTSVQAEDFTMSSDTDPLQLRLEFPNLSFDRPLDLQHPKDGTNRLFVVEQTGKIHVFENEQNNTDSIIFLDLTEKITRRDVRGNEEGLLGLTFHPDYEENGYFFVDYTAGNPRRTVVARFSVSDENPNQADPESEFILLEIEQPYSNHNGGQLVFGPDGYLYISMGDGGGGGDPDGNAQNLSNLLGTILRIDVDEVGNGANYSIPDDNPFVGNTEGYREEIYAYGLRNPWRISFDNETGNLWAGDVGQNAIEEIDIITSRGNYGWNIKEGTACYNPVIGCDSTGLIEPIYEYTHDLGRSITGGFVYRGSDHPSIQGDYIYADFISGRIWNLSIEQDSVMNTELFDTDLMISSFGVDDQNELYILAFDGQIYSFSSDDDTQTGSTGTTEVQDGDSNDILLAVSIVGISIAVVSLVLIVGRRGL